MSDDGERSEKIYINDQTEFNIWGVVTSVINKLIE